MRILGIDYGRRRVGLAITDPDEIMVTPLTTLIATDPEKLINDIQKLMNEESVGLIVIGEPIRDDGKEAELSGEIKSFARKLEDKSGLKVVLYDEYYSSARAEDSFHQTGKRIKGKKEIIDQLAAVDILRSYLESRK
ncbi:MAG: Holliday junction resolvase RuvX [candidate division Zixibacteria bacterium]|nr:Holliday junction resolvase RuvX [candidate division Zixibacteria bacterium]